MTPFSVWVGGVLSFLKVFVCLFLRWGVGGATPRRHARANDELTGMEEDGLF